MTSLLKAKSIILKAIAHVEKYPPVPMASLLLPSHDEAVMKDRRECSKTSGEASFC